MGLALLGAAALMLMTALQLFPAGGDTLGLTGAKLGIGLAGNFALGALMMLGIGLYAPCMILVYLLGMRPDAAFPIMMGSCAFLMPISSVKFVKTRTYHVQAALGLAIGGVPAALIAALIVGSLPLAAVRWLVVVVVVYTALNMLMTANQAETVEPARRQADGSEGRRLQCVSRSSSSPAPAARSATASSRASPQPARRSSRWTSARSTPRSRRSCAREFTGSITDVNLLDRMLAEFEVERVFHLAALLSTRSEFTPVTAHHVNVEGTLNLLEFAQHEGESHGRPVTFIYPSSVAAYGLPSLEAKMRAGARHRGSVRAADDHVRVQQAVLRAARALLREALQAAVGRCDRARGFPVRPVSRADLGDDAAVRRHVGLRAGNDSRRGERASRTTVSSGPTRGFRSWRCRTGWTR